MRKVKKGDMTQTFEFIHIASLFESWIAMSDFARRLLLPIITDAQQKQVLDVIDALMIEIGNESNHPLLSLLTLLTDHVEAFEQVKYEATAVSPERAITFLMDQRSLTHRQLEENIGFDQDSLAKILEGTHKLTPSQIKTLSTYFHVSPDLFIT
jgi:HTH-type transcriptional regulator/antitoxin HigA